MISGKILRDAIISGANNINNQRSRVDELNVFPVPDGDTGTNMSMTFRGAVTDLQKEENILFPYLLELFDASERNIRISPMHCGSIANPIRVMNMEHEAEGNRYFRIKEITNNFEVPQDGCNTYRLMMTELEKFVNALFEHIHIENNIMFPKSLELEQRMF